MKKLILSLVLTGIAGFAARAAVIEVNITGATAFRAEVFNTLNGMFQGIAVTAPTGGFPYVHNATEYYRSATASDNTNTFAGRVKAAGFGTLNGRDITVRCNWTGSAAGVGAVVNGTSLGFNSEAAGSNTISAAAHYACSDVFQDSTAFPTPALDDTPLGVVVFTFGVNSNAFVTGQITNITDQQFQ